MRHAIQLATLLVALACGAAANAQQQQEVWQWARNLDEARAMAAASDRLVLIHFYGNNCVYCDRLERNVFARPDFGQALIPGYVGVKVNGSLYASTARAFGVESWPTDVIVTPSGQVVDKFISPQEATAYTAKLVQTAVAHRQRTAPANAVAARPVVSYGKVRPHGEQAAASAAAAAGTADQYASAPAAYAAPGAPQEDRYEVPAAEPAAATVQTPVSPAPVDRYAHYNNPAPQTQDPYAPYQGGATQPAASAPPVDRYAMNQMPPQAQAQPQVDRYANYQQASNPPMSPGSMVAATSPSGAAPSNRRAAVTPDQLPPGAAPLAMDGYCPVTLMEQQRWVKGDVAHGITHEGRTYLFASAQEKEKFWQRPNAYSPVMAGNDPVIATDNGQLLPGSREHGLFVNGRVYLFVSEETLKHFEQNQARYVQSVSRTLR